MEAVWFKSGRHRGDLTGEMPVVVCLSFCGRYVADGFEQAVVVEPSDPFQRGQFDGLFGFPWRSTMNELCLVQAVDRLGQCVVVAVAFAALPTARRRPPPIVRCIEC